MKKNTNNSNKIDKKEKVIPVVKENLSIDIVKKEKGKILVKKSVDEVPYSENVNLSSTYYNIDRIEKNELLDEIPEIVDDNDKTILPIYKEVMVKKILLVEEVHIKKVKETKEETIKGTLKEEKITIENKNKQ